MKKHKRNLPFYTFSRIHGEDEKDDQSHQRGSQAFVFHQTLLSQPKNNAMKT